MQEGGKPYWRIANVVLQPLIRITCSGYLSPSRRHRFPLADSPFTSCFIVSTRGDKGKSVRSIFFKRAYNFSLSTFLIIRPRRIFERRSESNAAVKYRARQFPSSAYITHTISGYRSRLIPASSLPSRPGYHTSYFLLY